MRVFQFVNEEFGLEDLRHRRLKIATFNELSYKTFKVVCQRDASLWT